MGEWKCVGAEIVDQDTVQSFTGFLGKFFEFLQENKVDCIWGGYDGEVGISFPGGWDIIIERPIERPDLAELYHDSEHVGNLAWKL